ncbi:MaoC/PaaZ C-terminal domain-containing protein [Cellulomonas sp. HZM]|uniref:MaoC/PaaZ C-terminal domain-containing protein n=1 Tax=Cellulomonas sp. HZM TaxID=1454010 RepID=UPI0004931820|nr:MaoC/PaaZ C-terminal domain-containing protein [Cellulomonas sp. HZM]
MTDGAAAQVVDIERMPTMGSLYPVAGVRAATSRLRPASRELPATTLRTAGVVATAEHLTAYQHLLGESASDRLPAGFVHVLAFPLAFSVMVRPDFPLPVLGMVHVANRVTQHAPVTLGTPLDVTARARDLRAHRSGTQVDLVASVHADGELVWEGVSTYLAKGVRIAGDAPDDERAPFVAPVPTGEWRLGPDTGRRYAAVSGDRNPIHLSALGAKAFGFPRAIAHGMYTAARALADVGAARGDAFTWAVDFQAPVLLPSTVSVRVAADGDGFAFAGWDRRSGRPHLTGTVGPA